MNATTTPTTAQAITLLQEAGYTLTEHAPYGQTYEVQAVHAKGRREAVLVISRTGGRIVRATWFAGREQLSTTLGATASMRRVRLFTDTTCACHECLAEVRLSARYDDAAV